MDLAAEKAFENLIQDQESGEMILEKAKEMIWDAFAKGAGETMMFSLFKPFAGLGELKHCIKILLGMLNDQAALLKNTGQTNTLQSLPVEIRKDIFEYLLVNIELEEASSISQIGSYGAKVKYGLSPQILLVCRLFHQEGREVLYGSNRFYVESLPGLRQDSLDVQLPLTLCSPLTRWSNQRDGDNTNVLFGDALLQENASLRQVKKWKLVLSAKHHELRSQDALVEWCRLLCEHQTLTGGSLLRKLEICIIPKGVELDNGYLDVDNMREVLLPLELLRNIPKVSIRTAHISEIPDFVCSEDWNQMPLVTKSMLPKASYRRFLINLLQGNSEVELSTKMFAALEKYTLQFERDIQFRKDMSMSLDELVNKSRREYLRISENPFLDTTFGPERLVHTIEAGLGRARHMTEFKNGDITDTTRFKQERSSILKYLERQFGKISTASYELVEFVKDQKREWGIFDPTCFGDLSFDLNVYTEAIVLLEEYAASFTRELDATTKRAVRAQLGLFELRYNSMPREATLEKCRIAYKMRDAVNFRAYFRDVVSDMELQYFEILKARVVLYDWDLRGNIPDIKITPLIEPDNWHIRWELPEPEVTVPTKLLLLTIQRNIQNQIAYDKYLAQQLAEKEDGIYVPQGLEDANFTDEEEIHDHSTDIQHDNEGVSEDNLIDMENVGIDMAGWILLPFYDDDEFFSSTYQMDDNQFHSPSAHTVVAGIDKDSETNYFEELFRDDESLCSQYGDDADGEIVENIQEHINSSGSILHVLPWLKESHSSLSHVFP